MTLPAPDGLMFKPLAGVGFGCCIDFTGCEAVDAISLLEENRNSVLRDFYHAHGLMVIRGLQAVAESPELLVHISRMFGPEVENYRQTMTNEQFFHESVEEILVLSNLPPCRYQPPPQPDPPRAADGGLPTRYPHRRGWHTDQSYRRPPPDVSLLLGIKCPPLDQGQTLYADCISAYESLPESMKSRVADLEGIHAMRQLGRTCSEVKAGKAVKPLLEHQRPQRQPLVREHPESGCNTLYLCDPDQMDFIDGPILGLEPGLDGEGARMLDELVGFMTRREFLYIHEWRKGDLVIHDNRNMLHTATWYDTENHARLMWRTSVMGNPGKAYAGESKSWIPREGGNTMQGLEKIRF